MRRERIAWDPTRNNERVTDDLLSRGFEGATIAEMGVAVDTIVAKVRDKHPEAGALEQYRAMATWLPGRITDEVRQSVLQGVTSDDPDTSTTARRVLVMFYIKSVLSAIKPYLGYDPDENDDIVQAAMTSTYAGIPRVVSVQIAPNLEIRHLAEQGIGDYFVSMEGQRSRWITTGKYQVVTEAVEILLREHPHGLDRSQVKKYAEEIAKNCGVGAQGVKYYLINRLTSVVPTLIEHEEISVILTRKIVSDELRRVLATLSDKQKKVIELRFGLTDGRSSTLEEVAVILSLDTSVVRRLDTQALRKLRLPSRTHKLRQAIGMDSPSSVPPREQRFPSALLVLESSCPTDYLEITQPIWAKLLRYNIRTMGDLAGTFPSHLRTVFSEAEISALQKAVTKMLAGRDEKFMEDEEKKLRGRLKRWAAYS